MPGARRQYVICNALGSPTLELPDCLKRSALPQSVGAQSADILCCPYPSFVPIPSHVTPFQPVRLFRTGLYGQGCAPNERCPPYGLAPIKSACPLPYSCLAPALATGSRLVV